MQIQINTDKVVHGSERLESFLTTKINETLGHFDEFVTRIEVHLSDQNSHKSGTNDIQCTMEARIEGEAPIAVTAKAGDNDKAIHDAIAKMKAALSTKIGKMREHH